MQLYALKRVHCVYDHPGAQRNEGEEKMKTEKYLFATNLNGTDVTGIVNVSTNPPTVLCLCSKENSKIILSQFSRRPPMKRVSDEDIEVLKEIIRISDRKHNAWDKAKLIIDKLSTPSSNIESEEKCVHPWASIRGIEYDNPVCIACGDNL